MQEAALTGGPVVVQRYVARLKTLLAQASPEAQQQIDELVTLRVSGSSSRPCHAGGVLVVLHHPFLSTCLELGQAGRAGGG